MARFNSKIVEQLSKLAPEYVPFSIFRPHYAEAAFDVITSAAPAPMVHYTSLDAAVKIVKSKAIWLRRLDCMNDFLEFEHGVETLNRSIESGTASTLARRLNRSYSGAWDRALERFRDLHDTIRTGTHIFCLSRHVPDDEDLYGRLSMWRAYSRGQGVAIVLSPKPFVRVTDAIETYSAPVRYLTQEQFDHGIRRVAWMVGKHLADCKLSDEDVFGYIFQMLVWDSVTTKHPGFKEESEWRVAHMPWWNKSNFVESSIELVGGIPQRVYKLKLGDEARAGIPGVTINEVLLRLIIGPTEHAAAARDAAIELLREALVQSPEEKVVVSNIPLR